MIACLLAVLAFNPTLSEIFTEEYFNPLDRRIVSERNTAAMERLLEKHAIGSVIDAGCGQSIWGIKSVRYLGIDIVEKALLERRADSQNSFLCLDITEDALPQADAVICTDTLGFFSYRDIASALQQFKQGKSLYLIADTFPEIKDNRETATGIYRKINLQAFPFFFPKPLSFAEGSSLAIWKLDEIDLKHFEQCAFPPVTVLTKPVGEAFCAEHAAVAGSARRGLKKVCRHYAFNPDSMDQVYEHVVVITDLRAGKQACLWKRDGKIQTLRVGPNFAPSEGDFFIFRPILDCYLCNSAWPAENICRMRPGLENRISFWYAGVDETYWKPTTRLSEKRSKKALLYFKTDGDVAERAKRCLQECGYEVLPISYGSYQPQQFKQLLEEALFAVFISRSESQGIALAEAWSMDVPVFAWNPKTPFDWDGFRWTDVSSCPYMNPMVGSDWQKIVQLKEQIHSFENDRSQFQPRRWVLLHMTDKTSIEQLMELIRGAAH